MKLTGLDVMFVSLPRRRQHRWAGLRGEIGEGYVVVRIRTDEGLDGWGECPPLPDWGGAYGRYYGETPRTVRHVLEDLLFPAIAGEDPFDIARIHHVMDQVVKGHPYAKAALDIALFDLKGKALGVPVYQLLGGRFREWVPMGHSIGLMPVEPAVEEALQAVEEGIRTIKLKVGPDPARDVRLVRELRAAVGDGVEIRVDANQSWSVPTAIRTVRAMEPYRLLLVEEPGKGPQELARIARAVATPVMADESVWTPRDLLEVHRLGAAEHVSLYVTKAGGLYRARQVAFLLETLDMSADVGGSAEFGIGVAANLHLAAACPAVTLASIFPVTTIQGQEQTRVAGRFYNDDILAEPFQYRDGALRVPDGPGLGITVDLAKLERYRVG